MGLNLDLSLSFGIVYGSFYESHVVCVVFFLFVFVCFCCQIT